MRGNKSLLRVDLRLCSVGADFEYDVGSHLKKNRARVNYSLIERNDLYPPQSHSSTELNLEDEEEDEHEEEMEEILPPPEEPPTENGDEVSTVTVKKPPKIHLFNSGSSDNVADK